MNATPRSLGESRPVRATPLGVGTIFRDELPFLAGILFGLAVMAVFGFFTVHERNLPVNDFSYMWAGGHTVLDGQDPYDGVSFAAESKRFGTAPPHETVFAYPPWVALALVPLAALPLPIASNLFTFGGMLLAALALRSLVRARVPDIPVVHTLAGAALLASQPGIAAMEAGQWGFVVAAAAAWSVLALSARSTRRILVSLLLLVKPQVALFAAWAIVRAALAVRGVRAGAIVAAAFAIVVAAGVLVFPTWPDAYRATFVAQRLGYQPPTTPAQALFDLVGGAGIWLAVIALFAAVAAGLAFDPLGEAWLAVWIAISVAFPVYSWSYDQVALVVPLVITGGVLARRSRRAALLFSAGGFAFLLLVPTLLYEIANRRQNESFSAFVSLGVLALVLLALWGQRRERPEQPA